MSDGSQEIAAQIHRLADDLGGSIPVEAGTAWVAQDAKPKAQRLVRVDTGATRDSIDGAAGPGGIVMFATTDYSRVIEEGDRERPASPFLLPAIRTTLARLGALLVSVIDRRK